DCAAFIRKRVPDFAAASPTNRTWLICTADYAPSVVPFRATNIARARPGGLSMVGGGSRRPTRQHARESAAGGSVTMGSSASPLRTLFDILEIPQHSRGAGACRRLAKLMTELGWTAVRVRGLTRGGYKEQVRGYCRDARHDRHQH